MIIKTEVTEVVEVVEDMLCNKCGNSLRSKITEEFYGLTETFVSGGFDSTHLKDMERLSFALCEGCLVEILETFKHPPTQHDPGFP